MKLLFFLLPFSLLVFSACKKLDKDNPIEFKIKAHIPYSGEPISGVKYTIKEYKSKTGPSSFGDVEYTDFVVEGMTDTYGNATVSFAPKKNMKYHYDITFDYSGLQFANYSGSYSLIKAPNYVPLMRDDQPDFEIRALPLCGMQFKIENVNCFDSNDKMRYKVYHLEEEPNQQLQYVPYSNYFNGCGSPINYTNNTVLSGHQIYQIEVTRNNQLTTYIDTFFLQPGVMNEVFLEY
ncbi:hypothetical protein [Fluviicola chungangensis]|uniref:Carboxypeptidase regulatory-like domain-containing protein n=1 Tax=Fluviicola chungangensis TaxID=2597671 RepID=A0A556N2X4_9FLAO|nr:hypothetical protein [Fluviicola chungangensis]TSJ46425.1 hypothetical protein FO442_04510 [Fluviicola chungangensis]